jgi:hypothetical protein
VSWRPEPYRKWQQKRSIQIHSLSQIKSIAERGRGGDDGDASEDSDDQDRDGKNSGSGHGKSSGKSSRKSGKRVISNDSDSSQFIDQSMVSNPQNHQHDEQQKQKKPQQQQQHGYSQAATAAASDEGSSLSLVESAIEMENEVDNDGIGSYPSDEESEVSGASSLAEDVNRNNTNRKSSKPSKNNSSGKKQKSAKQSFDSVSTADRSPYQ